MNNFIYKLSFSAILVSICMVFGFAQNATIQVDLIDTFGDGWGGGTLTVDGFLAGEDCDGNPTSSPVSYSFSNISDPVETEFFSVEPGSTVSWSYSGGDFPGEVFWEFYDSGLGLLDQGNAVNATAGSFTAPNAADPCPDGPVIEALEINMTDDFGDGWDAGVGIEWENTTSGESGLATITGCCTSFDNQEIISGSPGDVIVLNWSASCGTFLGDIDFTIIDLSTGMVISEGIGTDIAPDFGEFNIDGVLFGTYDTDFGPGFTLSCEGADQVFLTFEVPAACDLGCPDGPVAYVLEDGDCMPSVTYDIGCPILQAPDFVSGAEFEQWSVTCPVLFALNNPTGIECDNNLLDLGNGFYFEGENMGAVATACGESSCDDEAFCNPDPMFACYWSGVTVEVPAGETALTFDWEYTPDCFNSGFWDQFGVVNWDSDCLGFGTSGQTALVFGGLGVQSGTTTIDVTEGEIIQFYIVTIDGNDGIASAIVDNIFWGEAGVGAPLCVNIETTPLPGEAPNCDPSVASASYVVDAEAGTVTIDYVPGITSVEFIYDPGTCNELTCEFQVTVDNREIKDALACNDHINVSVDENCEAYITADMVLEGSPYYCDDEYIITITTTGGNIVSNPLTYDPTYAPNNEYIVTVYDPFTCNSCWGTLTLEDKLDPVIECDCPPGAYLDDMDCWDVCSEMDRYLDGREGGGFTNDNCGGEDAVFSGATIQELDCGEYVVNQTWTLTVPGYGGSDVPTTLTCINQYYIYTPGLYDEGVLDCPDDEEFDCTEGGDPYLTHPDNTGYPEFDGVELGDGEPDYYCNIFATYEDLEIPACPGCYGPVKILRYWSILDWCEGDTEVCEQIIKIIDDTPPTIEAENVYVSTEPWVCSADIWFDEPLLHDDCTYDLTWSIASTDSGATLVDVNGEQNQGLPLQHALNVPKGWWNFTLQSVDCCGNVGYAYITVHVNDLTPPVAIATQNLTVSLTSSGDDWDGLAKVYASSINNGSHDNCSDVWVEIRRDSDPCGLDGNTTYSNKIDEDCDPWYDDDDHDYGDYVKFCCEDLEADGDGDGNADGLVKVWMRVWDDGNMDGYHGSYEFIDNPGSDHDYCEFYDNYNETWVWVRVEDKAPVQLICPPDIFVPCHWDWTDTSITGVAVASSNCAHPCVDYEDWPEVHCGEGYVLREWRAVDCVTGEDLSEYVCVQHIYVTYTDSPLEVVCPDYEDFEDVADNPDLFWYDENQPNHVAVDCEDWEFPEPWQSGGKCSLIGVSTDIDTFYFEQDACYKAIKSWTYVDWCTGEEAYCEFVVSLIDTDAPEIMCQDTCFAVDDYWDGDEDGIVCELADDVEVYSTAMEDGDCPSEWIKWVVGVDLWYDGQIDFYYSSFFPHDDDYYLAPTKTGDMVSIELDKDDISAEWARHVVEWKAFDGCGNVSQCHQYVEVRDKKAPTPYCVGISTALMSPEAGNLVEIWAKDFNLGSFDNCTADYWLRYTFGEVPPVADLIDEDHCFKPVWDDQENCIPQRDPETGLIVSEEDNNCGDYEDGATRPDCPIDGVQKWSPNGVDADGNPCKTSGMKFVGTDWCGENDIRVSVWDKKFNMDFCWVTLIVHGTECGDNGEVPRIEGTIATAAGETVEGVMVTNSSDLLAGGQEQFMTAADGTYAFANNLMGGDYAITADKNNDYLNGVSTLDLVLIQKHILGLTPLNTGTKVVAADINNDESISAVDLVELRKLILGIYTELPNNDSWRFIDSDQPLNVSSPWPLTEEVNISNIATDMMSEDFTGIKVGDVNGSVVANVNGITTEVRSSANLEFVIEALGNGTVLVKAGENFTDVYGYQFTMNVAGNVAGIKAGALNVSDANFGVLGNGIVTTSFASETAISAAAGEVLFTMNGINDITLVDGITKAEAYQSASLNVIEVTLRDGEGVSEFALAQNEPNPFSVTTNIAFTLGQSGNATLTIYDVTGKVIKVVDGEYERGNHVVQIAKSDLAASGVLYYQLESGDFTATKKMIVIK